MVSFVPRRMRKTGWRDKYRWVRSDGTPNFDDRIYEKPHELAIIAKKPVAGVAPSTPIIEALEEMSRGYRSLVVTKGGKLCGLIVLMDLVDYLGGGEYYNIVVSRHKRNIYAALRDEPVSTIMNRDPIVAFVDEKFPSVLEKMVLNNIGVVPVVTRDGEVYGIITERDILEYLSAGAVVGMKVSEVMSRPVVTIEERSTIKDAARTMVKYGFRRLPVTSGERVVGIITAMDVVMYFGSHEAFNRSITGDIEESLSIPVDEIMVRDVVTIDPGSDVGEAAGLMSRHNVGSVLVVEGERLIGIVTERDILYAIAAPKK